MMSAKIVTRTMFLAFMGILIIALLCINELYNGSGLTHPIWDRNYNWLPLIRDILLVSFIGSMMSNAAGASSRVKHGPVRKAVIKGGYQYGH